MINDLLGILITNQDATPYYSTLGILITNQDATPFYFADSAGMAEFLVPAGSYKLRVDSAGRQIWSDVVNIIAHEQTTVDLDLDILMSDLTTNPNPSRYDGRPPEPEPERLMLASLGSLPGVLAQLAVGQVTVDRLFFYINDHLGAPRVIVDDEGAVVWAADYLPFGQTDVSIEVLGNNFRYSGQYFDQETGLHYNWHRYYDPKTGRYLTPDPIGLAGGINLYSYVSNNPINLVDSLGLIEGSQSNLLIRQKIDQIARGYEGSTLWAKSARKDDFGPGQNKCNKFVYDVTTEAGAEALIESRRQPLASEWADPNTAIPGWRILEEGEAPMPGDVAAYRLTGGGASYSGHTGIITKYEPGPVRRLLEKFFPSLKRDFSNTSAHRDSVYPIPGQFSNNPNTRYRRYIGD